MVKEKKKSFKITSLTRSIKIVSYGTKSDIVKRVNQTITRGETKYEGMSARDPGEPRKLSMISLNIYPSKISSQWGI